MEWVVGILGVAVACMVTAHFMGKPKFWKLTRKYPAEALHMFRTEDCWRVFESEPIGGFKSQLPGAASEWTGPLRVLDPSTGALVVVFGKSPEMEVSQDRFVQRFAGGMRRRQRRIHIILVCQNIFAGNFMLSAVAMATGTSDIDNAEEQAKENYYLVRGYLRESRGWASDLSEPGTVLQKNVAQAQLSINDMYRKLHDADNATSPVSLRRTFDEAYTPNGGWDNFVERFNANPDDAMTRVDFKRDEEVTAESLFERIRTSRDFMKSVGVLRDTD